jgi:glutamine synthetase
MTRDELVMFCTCDLGGQVRGKAVPARDLERHLRWGVGWAPTAVMITAFGHIAPGQWGSFGDVVLQPDPTTKVRVDYGDERPVDHFYLADLLNMNGTPWPGCPRGFLRSALGMLERETRQRVVVAFEHEFVYTGAEGSNSLSGFHIDTVRRHALFAEALLHALGAAGIEPENILAEFGPGQFEVTNRPAIGMAAADRAIVVREIVRSTAQRLGQRASFSPIMVPNGMGNGVHVHLSLRDLEDRPTAYDPDSQYGLSALGGQFVAGIVKHMPALCAITAPSALSYQRLVPNHWSAAWNNLGYRDRESAMRICPGREGPGDEAAGQFNVEYRAADATANPQLVLGTLVRAGLEGIQRRYSTPEVTTRALSDADRARMGIVRLPQSLPEALAALEADDIARAWFTPELLCAYLAVKRHEYEEVKGLAAEELCARYREIY